MAMGRYNLSGVPYHELEREMRWRAYAPHVAKIIESPVHAAVPIPTDGGFMLFMCSGKLGRERWVHIKRLLDLSVEAFLVDEPETDGTTPAQGGGNRE